MKVKFEGNLPAALGELSPSWARDFQITVDDETTAELRALRERKARLAKPHPLPSPMAVAVARATADDVRLGRLSTAGVPVSSLVGWGGPKAKPAVQEVCDLRTPLMDLQERVRTHAIESARLDELGRLKAKADFEFTQRSTPTARLQLVASAEPTTVGHLHMNESIEDLKTGRKIKRPSGWWDTASHYIVAKHKAGKYPTAKELYRALEASIDELDSPFAKGEGNHRGSLIVRAIAQPLALKTLQNKWADIRGAAQGTD